MDNEEEFPMFNHLELQFLLSLKALRIHPIILYHLTSPLVWSSMPLRSLPLRAAVFLKKDGANLQPLFASVLEAHGITLTEFLGVATNKNWDDYVEAEHQPFASHHDDVPTLTLRKIFDGCFEVVSAPETNWTVAKGNFVPVCEESQPMFDTNYMLGKFRSAVEAKAGNIIWFFKTFWKIISELFSFLFVTEFVSKYVPVNIIKAFELFGWIIMAAIVIYNIAFVALGGRFNYKEIKARFLRCFNLLLKFPGDILLAVGEWARDGFNYLLFVGMLQIDSIALAFNDEHYSDVDPITIVCRGGMASILLCMVMLKRSSQFGLIGGVILSTVLHICWKILCTVPPSYWGICGK